MSVAAISEVWSHSSASATGLLVMLALADHADQDGVCFPYQQSLAEKARCDEKTVRRVIRERQDAGDLDVWEWYDKTTGRKRNCYRVVVGELAAFRGVEPDVIRQRASVLRVNVSTAVRRAVFERDKWTCVRCGSKVRLAIDHVIPVDEGGGNETENLQTLCAVCNAEKRALLPPGVESRPGKMSARQPGRNVRSERDEMSGPRAGASKLRLNRQRNRQGPEANASGAEQPPKAVMVDGRNLALDALLDECGIDDASPRVGAAAAALNGRTRTAGIRALFWIELGRHKPDALESSHDDPERFERALEAAVRRKARIYRERHPSWELTPTALRNHWLDLERAPAETGNLSGDDIRRMAS